MFYFNIYFKKSFEWSAYLLLPSIVVTVWFHSLRVLGDKVVSPTRCCFFFYFRYRALGLTEGGRAWKLFFKIFCFFFFIILDTGRWV